MPNQAITSLNTKHQSPITNHQSPIILKVLTTKIAKKNRKRD
jgi:hypothetical protein